MRRAPLVLASASPRRLDLLRRIGVDPVVRPAAIDEHDEPGETTAAYVRRLARSKALTVAGGGSWTLAADTVVDVDGERLGKPRDRADARSMLLRLAGRAHCVTTGVCLLSPSGDEAFARVVSTDVVFRPYMDGELRAYLETGEWTDKAGAYGIQGIAAMFASEVRGSWSNVVGLPLAEVAEALQRHGATGPLPATRDR